MGADYRGVCGVLGAVAQGEINMSFETKERLTKLSIFVLGFVSAAFIAFAIASFIDCQAQGGVLIRAMGWPTFVCLK
jgi:hypothetical protein